MNVVYGRLSLFTVQHHLTAERLEFDCYTLECFVKLFTVWQ